MPISVFRWTDGPYRAFEDQHGRRYIIEDDSASLFLDRLGAHLRLEPRESLVIERRFSRDDATDLWVSDIYFQECDNLFEVMTSNAPILLIAPGELCTVLRYSPDRVPRCPTSPSPEIPEFMQGAVLSILPALEGFMNASPDSTT